MSEAKKVAKPTQIKALKLLLSHGGRLFNPKLFLNDMVLAVEVTGKRGFRAPVMLPRSEIKVVAFDGVKETPIT